MWLVQINIPTWAACLFVGYATYSILQSLSLLIETISSRYYVTRGQREILERMETDSFDWEYFSRFWVYEDLRILKNWCIDNEDFEIAHIIEKELKRREDVSL